MCCISVLIATQTLLIIMFGICRREEMQLTTEAGGRGHQGGIKLSSKRSILSNLVVGINLVPATADSAFVINECRFFTNAELTEINQISERIVIDLDFTSLDCLFFIGLPFLKLDGGNSKKRKREIVQNFEDYVKRFGCTGGKRIRLSDLSDDLRLKIDMLRYETNLVHLAQEIVLIKTNRRENFLDIWDSVTDQIPVTADENKWIEMVDRFFVKLAKDEEAWHRFFEAAAKFSFVDIQPHTCGNWTERPVLEFPSEHIVQTKPKNQSLIIGGMVFDLHHILMRFDLFLPTISRLIMENGNLNTQTFQLHAWQVIVSCWGNNFDWTLIEDFLRAILKSLERSNDLLKAFFLQNKEISDSCCLPCTYREMKTVQWAFAYAETQRGDIENELNMAELKMRLEGYYDIYENELREFEEKKSKFKAQLKIDCDWKRIANWAELLLNGDPQIGDDDYIQLSEQMVALEKITGKVIEGI
eukprot:GHVH01010152.1.p1 GENE.GHVH01010152.1~~GHVH01010152.1.p1  ORF type:complete len:473 (-),score=52.61 GHVH01010152.1:89-1507(-)